MKMHILNIHESLNKWLRVGIKSNQNERYFMDKEGNMRVV